MAHPAKNRLSVFPGDDGSYTNFGLGFNYIIAAKKTANPGVSFKQ